jgi:hypothetical protein
MGGALLFRKRAPRVVAIATAAIFGKLMEKGWPAVTEYERFAL